MEPEPDPQPRLRRALFVPLLAALVLLASAAAAQASTLSVNTTSDAAPTAGECSGNPGDCSLRQAIDAAQPGDIVQLNAGDYGLTLGTDIEISKSLTIEGAGVSSTSIDGSQNRGNGATARIFRTDSGSTVTIEGLTLTGGDDQTDEVSCDACDTIELNGGGALWNDGATVLVNDVVFANNAGSPVGGAISTSGGTLTLTDVSFANNGAAIGGGLFTHYGTVDADGVTFDDDGDLGALYVLGGTVTLTNSTVVNSGASSQIGGGVHNGGGTLTLVNDTLSGNVRGQLMTDTSARTNVENTIIANGFSEGDGDCIAPGKPDEANGENSGPAITTDLGHNIDQDNSCNLNGTGDSSNVDPKLAPIADNGGPTSTQALLAGSPALGDPSSSDCPSQDQRGVSRPDGSCDIGAFEPVLNGPPTATTGGAANITDSTADLSATINLDGEAGGLHFLYGTTDDPADFTASPEVAAGVPDGDTSETQTLSNLTPATTYYYEAVADNASASTAGDIQQFTTAPGPPVIANVTVASVTDTTATITFSIDPEGSDTDYLVAYGPDENYGYFSQPTDLGSPRGPRNLSVTLTGLTPNSTYHFAVFAGNGVQHGVHSDDMTFNTFQQLTGVVGSPVTVTDSGTSDGGCPSPSDVTVDWGDDSSDNNAQIQCQSGREDELDYAVTDTHTYNAPGDYLVQINYSDFGTTTDVYADISPAPGGLQNTELPQINGTAQQGHPLTTTDGAWDGNPTTFDYQWEDCDSSGQNCTDTGTDANTYTPSQSDVGQTIRVIVTATNDAGDSIPATSDPTATVLPPAPSPPRPNTPPPSQPAAQASMPTVLTTAPTVSITAAGFSGSVTPNGLTTQAYFQYALDPKYTGGGPVVYDQSTAPQSVGSDFTSHTVGPVMVSGLLPNALYHVRLVATNTDGTAFGPDVTFTTKAGPVPGLPTLGKTANVSPVSGLVLIEVHGKFVPLTELDQIPSGSVIDATHGTLEVITAIGQKHKTQHGEFGGAIFRLTQKRKGKAKGLTTLSLLEGLLKHGPSYGICKVHKVHDVLATAAKSSSRTLQLLHASAHGKFSTRGRYGAATVLGTKWTIADRCDGTLIHDITDSVMVNDFVHHRKIILHAGQSYLVLAPGLHQHG